MEVLLSQAEKAVGAGDLEGAVAFLERAAENRPDDPTVWVKLAAMQRGRGKPRLALDAVHRALALTPLDFAALLMRASLLDALEDPAAPEAWGHALANKPAGDLPPQLAAAVSRG